MRLQGWEGRLEAVIEAERYRAFAWGAADCWGLACAAARAITGEDPGAALVYGSKRQALAIVAARARSFPEFVSLHWRPVAPACARKGDLMLVPQPGMPALGVCLGALVAVRGERRMGFVPRAACTMAWRVG